MPDKTRNNSISATMNIRFNAVSNNALNMDFNSEAVLLFKEAIVFAVLIYFGFLYIGKPKRKLPPGPIGLPFVGYLPFLTKKPYVKLSELRKKYGGVFGFYLGQHYTVILSDPITVKETFNRPEFLGRPERTALSPDKSRRSMSIISGHQWLEQRRFLLHSMNYLGIGKSRMEEHIKDEVAYLIEAIRGFKGEPMEVKKVLASCTNNIVLAFTCGRRLDYCDPMREIQNQDFEVITNFMAQTSVQGYIAAVMKIPGLKQLLGYNDFRRSFQRTMDFIKDEIERHSVSLNEDEVNDLVTDYLLEMQKQGENSSSSFSDEMLQGNLMMLFLAGSETVRTAIDWALYVLAVFPSIQAKVLSEIDDVIGFERWPTWLDHKEMPYTQSVLTEVLRWRPPIPINLQRCTLADTTVCGYDIPKGTIILANFWDIHHNSEQWENPEEFQPTRFLSTNDNKSTKSENLMPFSFGKRSCPGQALALVEIFLFVTAITQKFNIRLPEDCKQNFDGVLAIVNQPHLHKLQFTSRAPYPERDANIK